MKPQGCRLLSDKHLHLHLEDIVLIYILRKCGHIIFVYLLLLTCLKMGRHTPGASKILALDFIDILLSGPTNSNFITLHTETHNATVFQVATEADLSARGSDYSGCILCCCPVCFWLVPLLMQASIRQCYCSSLRELGNSLCRLLNELAPVKKWRVADIWLLKMKLKR